MSDNKDVGLIAAEEIKDGVGKSVRGMKKVLMEFKDFALRGNMIDMAVGIVIGTAFGAMVKSIVEDTLLPAITYFIGGANYEDLAYHGIKYGLTITHIINFFILALVVFLVIKTMNVLAGIRKSAQEEEKEEVAKEIELLSEIRDIMKGNKAV